MDKLALKVAERFKSKIALSDEEDDDNFYPSFKEKPLALQISNWHGGQGDVLYLVSSNMLARHAFPREKLDEAADALEKNIPKARAKQNGWGPEEVKELTSMVKQLRKLYHEGNNN